MVDEVSVATTENSPSDEERNHKIATNCVLFRPIDRATIRREVFLSCWSSSYIQYIYQKEEIVDKIK